MVALVYEIIFNKIEEHDMVSKERSADKIKQKDRIKNTKYGFFGIAELDLKNGNVTENWKRWKQTMQLMLQGPLAEKEEKQQYGYFLLYLGQGGRDIYNTWTITEAEQDKIQVLFDKYEAYCNPKQNVTVIRYKFNPRNQGCNETTDQYVTELKRLAKDCSYGGLKDKMIRDRIVCGTNNSHVKVSLRRKIDPNNLPKFYCDRL